MWDIHPRDADLGRTLDPISRWSSIDLVERYNQPSTWVITGPAASMSVFTPAMGCILDRAGDQIVSGQVRHISRKAEYDDRGRLQDNITVGFVEDTQDLFSRLLYPDPAKVLTGTPSTFAVSHDTRTGTREGLILAYTAANIGPTAPQTIRRMNTLLYPIDLVLPVDLGRGGTTTKKARMDVLGDVVAELAEQGGLRVRIVHDESTGSPRLLMTIDDIADVSDDVVFGTPETARATGLVTSWGYSIEDPEVTTAIGFAAGELTARIASLNTSVAAVNLWNRRSEVLVDQRQTDNTDEITAALAERLQEGATPTTVELTVAQGGDVAYRQDYNVGYKVGVELPGLPEEVSDNTIREATTRVSFGEPEEVSFVVGTPGAENTTSKQGRRLKKALEQIAMLERSR